MGVLHRVPTTTCHADMTNKNGTAERFIIAYKICERTARGTYRFFKDLAGLLLVTSNPPTMGVTVTAMDKTPERQRWPNRLVKIQSQQLTHTISFCQDINNAEG